VTADEQPVLCMDCHRRLRTPGSRARRLGPKCLRDRRREAAVQLALLALPGGGRTQTGPDLLTNEDVEEVEHVDQR
jgi:hypothetical protein